ncbi:acetyl-CoA decarbonylase/synthase complex subunit gamma [Candidatus Desantisbacteria bacterium]|nr:acetyl-CoA decarbonylase/synthase complex subunit gamma [Candidatus Desantisbacteria bacterium]
MALSGIQIFKYLPKTNCGKCKFPTCLAFAMKLAAKQASLDDCPDASNEAKEILGAASEPPIRLIKIGTGEDLYKVGEEAVMFRHEKTFYNPCGFSRMIKDTDSTDNIKLIISNLNDFVYERVGQHLKVDIIYIKNESGDKDKFVNTVKLVQAGIKRPLILDSSNIDNLKAALDICADKKPLIYAANEDNYETMTALAKEKGCSLVVTSIQGGLEALSVLTEKITGLGFKDIVLDPASKSLSSLVQELTQIRRAAIKKSFKPLGFPVIIFSGRYSDGDRLLEANISAIGVSKYASIIVMNDTSREIMIPLFAMRQNIYTDPQKPMQVEEKIYKIGEANEDSPVLITTNFSLTYFIVAGEVENSKVPSWLVVANVEGLSVLTAWAAGKFTPEKITKLVKESGIESMVKHRKLIIPGYVAVLSGGIESKLPDWKIQVGPREASGIINFLKNYAA